MIQGAAGEKIENSEAAVESEKNANPPTNAYCKGAIRDKMPKHEQRSRSNFQESEVKYIP
jgi:hypothetical protein